MIKQWSYGLVGEVADLYCPRIFGSRWSFRCECGKYMGEDAVGCLCDSCGVLVCADAAWTRCERLGHIELACPVAHPFDNGLMITAFPIVPIAFRADVANRPNALGEKYEAMVETNLGIQRSLAAADTPELLDAGFGAHGAELIDGIRQIVGAEDVCKSSLLAITSEGLLTGGGHIGALLRSLGYSLRLDIMV
jgi:hypothetical protein